ncbi:MAG: hypothetical protein HUJ72_08165 [Blautia sp.]|nr:hypothetical protein [Blautia sp.]
MELFLYTNINYLRDVLGANAIVCTSSCEKPRTPSLGIVSSTKLFLTHKKINKDIRNTGLDNSLNNGEVPVTLQLRILEQYSKEIPIQRVQIVEGKVEFIEGNMSEYDPSTDEGCFWGPFIPMSYLKGIVFEIRDDYKQVFTPSPDLWYPEDLYSEINSDDFTESIEYDLIKAAVNDTEEDINAAKNKTICFEKRRAILYYALKLTENWEIGSYKFNFDPYIIKALSLDAEKISNDLGVNKEDVCPDIYKDTLCSEGYLGKINKVIIDELMSKDITTEFESSVFDDIVSKISAVSKELEPKQSEYVDEVVKAIRDSLFTMKGLPFAEVLEKTSAVPPLKALLCLFKYPHDYEKISGSLVQYGVGQEASRLAAIYFAAVHGMEFLEGIDKNNLLLERQIDAASITDGICSIYSEDDYKAIFDKDVSSLLRPMFFISEKVIQMEEVYEYFASNKKNIQVSKIKSNLGKKVDWDKYLRYVIPEGYKPGDSLTKKQADDLAKRITTPVEKSDEFIEEYFSSIDKFKELYDVKPDFWKTYYKNCSGKR